MNKNYVVLALLLVAQISWANVITGQAKIPAGYYDGVDKKASPDAILEALFKKIKGHTVINYNNLEDYYEQTDFRGDSVWDMYSTCHFTMAQANHSQSKVCDGWNKEHSIPQSWFNEGSPMKSDLFHVYPTDARVNNFRGNEPYGEVDGPNGTGIYNKGESKTSIAPHALGKVGSNTFPGCSGTVYEPADEYKGDFARTYFYMVARYRETSLTSSGGNKVFTSNNTNLTEYAKNLFLKWHRQDPVSQKEIDRNEAVYKLQNNRNPFIDYPDFAEYIWGDRVGQTVQLSEMTPTCEGGTQEPPMPTVKHGITWSVCGTESAVDSIGENTKIKSLPETPVTCSSESPVFVGWTTAPIIGIADEAPVVLYAQLADFPAVTEDVTYYAVFAKETLIEGAVEPATYTYNTTQKDGWTNTATWKNNAYWLLVEGSEVVSPDVNLSGLSSISMKMRTFNGSGNPTVTISAAENTIASLTASNNKINDYSWTNTGSLSGTSPLRFTANGSSTQGVGFTEIVIQVSGEGVTASYDRFITDFQSTTEIENHPFEIKNQKLLINGQLYILLGEQLFNLQGQRVK